MHDTIRVGDEVIHRRFGRGIVLEDLASKGLIKGRFASAVQYVVRADLQRSVRMQVNEQSTAIRVRSGEDREKNRQLRIQQIQDQFREDFLGAEAFFRATRDEFVSLAEFETEKILFVRSWATKRNEGRIRGCNLPDSEQAAAIGAFHGHVQVVARAGSGKTSTLVNRAIFLQECCQVDPSAILILAFNSRAAAEIEDRFTQLQVGGSPYVMTFHALAHALVHPDQDLLHDSSDGRDQRLSRFVQAVIDDHIRRPEFYWQIRQLMTSHFNADWEMIESGGYHLPKEEMLRYRRSLQRETLRGDFVKSYGEKVIANFLFENRIPYLYERAEKGRLKNYKPDFMILRGDGTGVVIEYFGMVGDPDYDEMTQEKRRYWAEKRGWTLVEYFPEDLSANGIEGFHRQLHTELERNGFVCDPMSDDEIWHQICERAVDRFTAVVRTFIARCRKLELTPRALSLLVSRVQPINDVEARFLSLATRLFVSYTERLAATNSEDFDGLMGRAAEAVRQGQTAFSRFGKKQHGDLHSIRFILIDEYQDFSKMFHSLIEAIREQNPTVELFCVGDDWQAINGFAGSDLRFYRDFTKHLPGARALNISTNYRSKAGIVRIGNRLMEGLGEPARAHAADAGDVLMADVGDFVSSPSEDARHGDDKITPMALRIAGRVLGCGNEIVFLSRTNNIQGYINYSAGQDEAKEGGSTGIERFERHIRSFFPKEQRPKIRVSTTHRFKGLQGKVVVILDAVANCYPLIHQDWIFLRALGESVEEITAEARRLFYVALTRAAETLIIFTDRRTKSPFLEEIESTARPVLMRWNDWPPVAARSARLTVMIGNQPGRGSSPTMNIKDLLKQEGYVFRNFDRWPCWVRTFPHDEFTEDNLRAAKWFASARGVEVRVLDEQDRLVASLLL